MTDNFADKLTAARSRIAASLLPKISSAVAASSASKLTATPMGNNLKEHIANGGQPTNDMINYFNDKTIADGINRQNISDAQQNDYYGVSTANLTSSNVFMAAAANAANLVGGAVGTLAQWGNTLAGDEFTAQAIAMEAGTPAHVLDAYNTLNRTREQKNQLAEQSRVIREQIRNKQGDPIQLSAQLLAIETAYKGIQVDPNVMTTLSVKSGDTTYLEKLDASQELRHKGARVTAGSGEGILPAMKSSDFSNPYYKKPLEQANKGDQFITDTNALADRQLDEGTLTGTLRGIGNKVLATGKSIGNVLAAGVENPMGVLQYTAESAPYFLAPELGTVAIVNQTAVEGRHKFEERTGQALPTTGQNAAMLATDALYGALNYIGDKAVNSAIRGTTAASVRSSSQVLLDAVRGVGSTGLRAAGKEGFAEGAQTYLEESGQNLGTYFNPDTVGQAAAIGAMSSGVVLAPSSVRNGIKEVKVNTFLNSPAGQEALAQVEKQKVLDAIPLAELQDTAGANFNPVEAINRMTTGVTDTTKDTVIADVSALVNNLQDVVTERETSLANAEQSVAQATKTIDLIDQAIAGGNTDPALVDARKAYTDFLEGDGSPENIKKLQDLVTTSTSELVNAHEHAKIKLKAVRDAFGVANPNTAPVVSVPTFNAPISTTPVVDPAATQPSSGQIIPYTQGVQGETFIFDDDFKPIPVEVISDVTTEEFEYELLELPEGETATGYKDYVTIRYTDETGEVVEEQVATNSIGVKASGTATQSNTPPANPSTSTGGTVYPYPSKGAGLRAALEANDSTKNYTPEQRDTLRAFSDAVVLIHSNKDLQKVGIDIKQGGNTGGQRYRGLEQYMERVVEAINNGNVRSQQYFNKGLALFSQSHTSKAETFQKAFDTLTPGMVNIVQKNDDTNTWEIYDTVTEKVFNSGNFKEGLKNTGGHGIHRNSLKFIETVKSEAEGIAQVSDAINLMVNGSQSVAPTPAVPASVVAPTPPVVTEPSDTTPVDVTPAPEAPVQSAYPTWDTMTQGQEVTLYRGESSDNTKDGQWWTTNKAKAEKYGKVTEVTLSAEVIGKHAAQGQGGTDEFYFANKRPSELVTPSQDTLEPTVKDEPSKDTTTAIESVKQAPIESTEVVVVPETVVPVTPPDSETGDVEIQEDVSSFPEVAEPKEETTPAGGLSILAGTGSVKDRMKAEQEKAADQILRAGSTIVIDRSKVDKEDGRAWLAKVATTTKEIITTGIQRANLVVASFYQKAKAPSKLVQVKDFAAKVLAMSPAEQAQMLSEALGETATDSQVQFLENFLMFDKSLRGTMDAMAVPSGQDGFRFKDYLQYLYTDIKSETKTVKVLNKKTKTLEDVDQVITTGTLDENVKTAISLGIHTFLIEKTGQFTLDHEGVAELLGIKNTKSVPPEVHRMFRSIGNTQPNVVKYLGTKAYQALQLSMDPNVPAQRKESLINALGSLAVQTMMKEGLLQYTRISNDTILNAKAAIKGETNKVKPSNSFTLYLRPTYDTKKTTGKDGWVYESEPKPIARIEALKMSAKGNTKVMSKLFSVDGRDILPMLKKPTKFTQPTLSNTGNEVPDATADLVLQMMQKAYNVNGYTYSAMKTLFETDPDALYAMVGVVSDEDVALEHITKRGAIESKNEALKRSVVNGLDFIDSLTTDEDGNFPDYYLPMSVSTVNRVFVGSNMFNEQGDKVHRALTTMTAHKQQVTISPVVDSDNKLTQYGRFLTGVAAYMEGIKINGKTVDKTDGVSFLPDFEAYISTPEYKEIIESAGAIVLGTATAEDIERVQIEVIKLEGGAMSLTSLIALYEASQTKEVEIDIDGVKTKVEQFTTSMSVGSDGVTNGMAISVLIYDAASPIVDFVAAMTPQEKGIYYKANAKGKEAMIKAKEDAFNLANPKDANGMTEAEKNAFNAGGIFFEGDEQTSMAQFRKLNRQDLYQQLAKVQLDFLKKFTDENPTQGNFIAAMNNIDPIFGSRGGAKVSLVPFVYTAGFPSIGAAQSRAFMEQFYKALTKAMLSGDAAKVKQYKSNYTALIKARLLGDEAKIQRLEKVHAALSKEIHLGNRTKVDQFQANYVALARGAGIKVDEIIKFNAMSLEEALDTELSVQQVKAITGLENEIRIEITKGALSQVAGTLIKARGRVSGLANVGFESYNRMYRALYNQAYAKLAKGKFLPYRIGTSGSLIGEEIVVEGMSVSQNQKVNDELKDFTPHIISVGGVYSINGKDSAHSSWKESEIQDTTDTGTVTSAFGDTTGGKALPAPNSDLIYPSKSISTSLHVRSVESRGAAITAAIVQAMDARVTSVVSAVMDTFNHHDENVSAIDKAIEMGQLQNKTLFNAVLDYDVYLEVLNGSLLRPLRGIIKLSKRDDTLAIAKEEVGKVMADLRQYMDANFGGFNEDMGMLASLVHEMYALEIAKLTKYKNLKSISQYGIEGGEYTVTKKDVARINDLIASHVASRTALLKEVAKMSADLKAIGAKPKAEPEVKAETKEETPKGKPASVDSFIVRNEEGVVDTLATLNSMPINDSTLVGKVIKQVVEALKGKLPANLKVHMLAGNVLPKALDKENVKDTLSRGSAGVTYSVGNTHTIGLVEGKAGKITFIHELIHAATVSALQGTSPEARKLKVNISKLRSEALSAYRKYTASLAPVSKIEAERRDKVFMDAFNSEGDKDAEFVAMAMSEPAIIDFLATVPAPKTTNTGTLMSVFSAFIKSVGEFLGVVKNAQGKDVESVLEAMVRQTAHLMSINDQSSASEQINNYPGQQAAVDAVRLIREYPSKEIFNVLPASLDVGFDTYLSSLMDTIVDKTFNHLSFPSTTYTPLEVWENAITDGRTPYTTRAVAAGYVLSERELFAIETLEVALKGAMDAGITTPVYREMERAYESARKTLKDESFYNGDWSTALESDREIARNKRKHLFKLEGGQATRSDYMSRFMAMALASSEVNSLLGFPTLTEPRVDGTISSKVLAYYEYAMDWVSGHLTGTMRYQTINSKLPTLAQKLVDIDHKKRDQALSSVYDSVSDNLNKADKYLKESGNALADKLENMIGDSKKGLPSAARTASRVVLRGAAMDMLKVSKIWRDMSAPNTVLGWKGELLNELSDPSSVGQAVRSLLRIHTRLQTERKTHKSTTKESILSNFLNGGKNLSKDDHSAITYGVLRGDLKALYDLHGIRGIEKLLNDKDYVASEVARLEGLITNETHLVRGKDLAHYMTSGEVNLMLAKNALSIARDVGLPTVLEEGMVSEEAVSNIDMLVSLYAIQYMKSSHLQTLQKLFKQEGARTDGNGLAALMKYHQAIEQEAKDTLFEGNSVSIIKGYTPEITNPHREIKIVTLATDAKHLEAMGYQLHSILSADPNDVNQAKRMMYFTEEPSTQRFVTGAMSLTADSSKGTSIIDGSSLSVKDKFTALKSITTRSATKLSSKSAKDYDPTAVMNRGISPTYSNLGSIQDFRYEMTHATRDGLLQRNNNFAEIMGTYAGSNFDKASTPKHNETVIDALYKDYKENYLKDPRAYVMIGKDATDPKAVEMYAMLPYKTRKYIDKVWGKREPMWVRNDALLATFGTNKYSIGEAFEKNPDTRNIVEKTIVGMFKVLFGDTAKLRALQGERLNQELVSWFKSTIVIRNLTTLMGNQSANVGVLLVMGVSPVDIIKDSVTAFKAGNRFRKDNTELVRVENNMKANVGNFEDNVQLQARLKDSIARNPLKEFLDAGMLNTIVEDVSLDVEDYNYKSKLAQQLDDQLDKLNPTVRKIGANLVVAPSTELYQVLANATQLSDFTAKYTLYKHLTSKAKDKLSHEDALAMADRMFINYDVPTSKELQYANDMGFIMFTKYTLRIQRAIAYLLKERKASLLAQGMLGTALGMPLAVAPAFFLNVGLPFHAGALMVPGALVQPLPIKVLSGGF